MNLTKSNVALRGLQRWNPHKLSYPLEIAVAKATREG